MAAITSITENWSGHSFKEVETHIKGSYLPLTSVSVDSISSGVANVLTLNSSNAVKKTSLSDLASLLGGANLIIYKEEVYPDVTHLAQNIINQTKTKGFGIYSFIGSWTNHSGGYCSVISYNVYDGDATRICGTIYAFTGEVYAFMCNQENTLKIATIGTMS